MTAARPPSWWKFVAGRDADRKWSRFYADTMERGGTFPPREQNFYVNAIKRLTDDSYAKEAHRPKAAVNFWLTCYYQLAMLDTTAKAAAIDAARLAKQAGITKGHTPKEIQRHANELKNPAAKFLRAVRAEVRERAPTELPEPPSDAKVNAALLAWTARMVERSVR